MVKIPRSLQKSSLAQNLRSVAKAALAVFADALFYTDVQRIKVAASIFTMAWSLWLVGVSLPRARAGVDIGALMAVLVQDNEYLLAFALGIALFVFGALQYASRVSCKSKVICDIIPVVLMLLWFWVAYLFIAATWFSTATPVYLYMFAVQFWISWRSQSIYYDSSGDSGC